MANGITRFLAVLLGACVLGGSAFGQACIGFADILTRAADVDPSVGVAEAGLREAEAGLSDAWSLSRPQVSVFGRTGAGAVGLVDGVFQNQVGARVSQRVLDFGDARFARRAARARVGATSESVRLARQDAASAAGTAYFDFFEASAGIAATRERASYFRRQEAALQALLARGGATRADLADAAAQRADAEALVLELEFARDDAETRLQILAGAGAGVLCTNDADALFRDLPAEPETAETAVRLAVAVSPELRAIEAEADALQNERRRERRRRLPIIEVVGIAAYTSTGDGDFTNQERVGVDVSLPIYSGSALGARVRQASAREAAAAGRVERARRDLEAAVRVGVRRAASLRRQYESRLRVELRSLDLLEAAEEEFEAGFRTLPDLVDVRLDYEDAALRAIRTRYDQLRSEFRLYLVTLES